jgi:hypothetical protein
MQHYIILMKQAPQVVRKCKVFGNLLLTIYIDH